MKLHIAFLALLSGCSASTCGSANVELSSAYLSNESERIAYDAYGSRYSFRDLEHFRTYAIVVPSVSVDAPHAYETTVFLRSSDQTSDAPEATEITILLDHCGEHYDDFSRFISLDDYEAHKLLFSK